VKDLHAADWEALARSEPYFCVLDHDGHVETGSNSVATPAFFETGEADIASLLSAIASLLGRAPSLTSSLDFGCGAGRLTLALARRSTKVVACDVAPTMLEHVRRNAHDAGLQNVTCIGIEELARLPNNQFDFICSLLVFQYIPRAAGYELIRTLLKLLEPGGIAALHVALGRSRKDLNQYDEEAVHREIETAGARLIGRFNDSIGAVLIIEGAPSPSRQSP